MEVRGGEECGTRAGSSVRYARRSNAASSTTFLGLVGRCLGINGREDENWWLKGLLEREQLPMPLPTALALRREVADLPQTLADVPDERAVRDIIEDLNRRIRDSHRRRVDGPPIVVKPIDVEQTVNDWRRSRSC